MADSELGDIDDFNAKVIEEFRANEGRVGGLLAGTPMILLHHIGARSGTERVTPLAYTPRAGRRFVLVASNGGSPAHPGWYYNLKANPRVTVEVGAQTFTVLAEELHGAARAELWPELVAQAPDLGRHQRRTTRQIPVFMLIRQDLPATEPRNSKVAMPGYQQPDWQETVRQSPGSEIVDRGGTPRAITKARTVRIRDDGSV